MSDYPLSPFEPLDDIAANRELFGEVQAKLASHYETVFDRPFCGEWLRIEHQERDLDGILFQFKLPGQTRDRLWVVSWKYCSLGDQGTFQQICSCPEDCTVCYFDDGNSGCVIEGEESDPDSS